jgi:hypothetical protein
MGRGQDRDGSEEKKKAVLSLKEKRKLKKEKHSAKITIMQQES